MKRIVFAILLLLGSSSIPGCASDPCSNDPGSLACNKHEAARSVYRTTRKQCMYEWKQFEKGLPPATRVYLPCGDAATCCIELARLKAARILR